MIKIEVDEAYAFDMLAIAELKLKEKDQKDSYNILFESILNNLEEGFFRQIYMSDEYDRLYFANKKVYDYIEKLVKGDLTITASDIHSANMDRYKYKKELQDKFFGTKLSEQKTV